MSSYTVMGQGSPPKPDDETYLALLKKSVKPIKIKIDVKKEKDEIDEKEVVDITKN